MLSLERPLEAKGILVYRDHSDGKLFYYAAPDPKISKIGGRLGFDLNVYAVELKHSPLSGTNIPDELGAGFLTMTVDCEMPQSKLNAVRDDLSSLTGIQAEEIVLTSIPYQKGAVSVIALDKYSAPTGTPEAASSPTPLKNRPTFVEEILGSATPSLLGDLRTIFSLSLSQDGVAFLEGLFSSGSAPVGVVYQLSFLGLRPAVDVKITADISKIYTHFGGGIEGQYSWLKVDVSAALDYLEQHGAIDIDIVSQATGEDAQKSKELAMSLFKDRIVKDMFEATVSPSSQATDVSRAAGSLGNSSGGSITLKLKYQKSEELKTVVYDFSEVAPEERVHNPQSFLPVILSQGDLLERIHRVDLASDFFELMQVVVTGPTKEEFEALGIRQVEATLSYGEAGSDLKPDLATLLFRPDNTGDKTFAVRRRSRKSMAYSCSLTYEFARSASIDADSSRYILEPRICTARTLRINPFADFGVFDVEIEPGRIHPDISSIDVDLQYESPDGTFKATETVRLDPGTVTPGGHHWQVRTAGRELSPYTAGYTFFFMDGSEYRAPVRSFTEPLLRVDSPFRHERRLLVQPNVISQEISQITIEVEYSDEVNSYGRRFLVTIMPPFASTMVSWPILNPEVSLVRYRTTVHEPGFVSEGEWEETLDPSIVVGARGSRVVGVTIRLIGPPLKDVGIDAVMVKMELAGDGSAANQQSVLLDGSNDSVELKLTLPPDSQIKYRYQTTTFKADGSMVESSWKEGASQILPLSTRSL